MIEEKPLLSGILGRANDEILIPGLLNVAKNLPFILTVWKALDREFPGVYQDFTGRTLNILKVDLSYLRQDPGNFPWFWRPVVEGEHEDWATHCLVIVVPDRGKCLHFYTTEVDEISPAMEWDIVQALLTEEYMSLESNRLRQTLEFYKEGDRLRQLPEITQEVMDLIDSVENWLENPNREED